MLRRVLIVTAALGGAPLVSVAAGAAPPAIPVRITISDSVTVLGSHAEQKTYSKRFVVTKSGSKYLLQNGGLQVVETNSGTQWVPAQPEELSGDLVEGFVRTVEAWRFPAPSAASLALTPVQSATLAIDLAHCSYKGSPAAALLAYYDLETVWTDDSPDTKIEIVYDDGRVVRLESHNQQLFGLPWRIELSDGRESLSYDSEISRALLPLLDQAAPNANRFDGGLPFAGDPFLDVAGVACETSAAQKHATSKNGAMTDVYGGLREQALRTSSSVAGQPPGEPDGRPFGVVADIGFDGGSATVVAFLNGSASIYLSGGGGYIGGSGHESVASAAKRAVQAARGATGAMHPTRNFPLPTAGNVTFYVLTSRGVMTASSPEDELAETTNPLRSLYMAVQDVITQYRLINKA